MKTVSPPKNERDGALLTSLRPLSNAEREPLWQSRAHDIPPECYTVTEPEPNTWPWKWLQKAQTVAAVAGNAVGFVLMLGWLFGLLRVAEDVLRTAP